MYFAIASALLLLSLSSSTAFDERRLRLLRVSNFVGTAKKETEDEVEADIDVESSTMIPPQEISAREAKRALVELIGFESVGSSFSYSNSMSYSFSFSYFDTLNNDGQGSDDNEIQLENDEDVNSATSGNAEERIVTPQEDLVESIAIVSPQELSAQEAKSAFMELIGFVNVGGSFSYSYSMPYSFSFSFSYSNDLNKGGQTEETHLEDDEEGEETHLEDDEEANGVTIGNVEELVTPPEKLVSLQQELVITRGNDTSIHGENPSSDDEDPIEELDPTSTGSQETNEGKKETNIQLQGLHITLISCFVLICFGAALFIALHKFGILPTSSPNSLSQSLLNSSHGDAMSLSTMGVV